MRLCTACEHSPYLRVAYPKGEASLGPPKEEFGRMCLACIKALSKTLPNIHGSSHIPALRLTSTSSCRTRRLNFAVPKRRFFQKSFCQILPARPLREAPHPGYATRPCNTATPHAFKPSLYLRHSNLVWNACVSVPHQVTKTPKFRPDSQKLVQIQKRETLEKKLNFSTPGTSSLRAFCVPPSILCTPCITAAPRLFEPSLYLVHLYFSVPHVWVPHTFDPSLPWYDRVDRLCKLGVVKLSVTTYSTRGCMTVHKLVNLDKYTCRNTTGTHKQTSVHSYIYLHIWMYVYAVCLQLCTCMYVCIYLDI